MTFRWLPEYKYEYEYEYATRPSEYRLSLSVFQRMSIPMPRIKGWGQAVALSKSAAPNSMKVLCLGEVVSFFPFSSVEILKL